MAICRPKTIDDAPEGPQRGGGRCRGDPRLRGGMLSCLARNGRSPGEESLKRRRCGSADRGAAGLRPDQAITEARCVRALNHKSGRGWWTSVRCMQEVETIRRRKRNVGRQKAVSSIQGLPRTKAPARTDVDAINDVSPKYSEDDRDYLSLKLGDPRSARCFNRSDSTGKWRWIIVCALPL
jgi:hypothetical protein